MSGGRGKPPLDQFYTRPALARALVADLLASYDFAPDAILLEPSAGAGAFYRPLKESGYETLALDIAPACRGVRRADFLAYRPRFGGRQVVIAGNPPFGFAAAGAVRFFNRAAEYARLIAFIVPRTFRKISVQNRLNRHFWPAKDADIPPRAFIKGGAPHDVPCAWQVWEYRARPRPLRRAPDISRLMRYTGRGAADFALRRVGGRAGAVLPLSEASSASSNYFIRQKTAGVRETLRRIDWDEVRNSTAGVRSISKAEIAFALARAYGGICGGRA